MPNSTTFSLDASAGSHLLGAEDAAETEITNQLGADAEDIIFMDTRWYLAAANGHTHVLQE